MASPRSPLPFALAGLLAACSDSRQRSENIHVTSTLPPPGSVSVSRRVEILTVFDQDVDPASVNATSCRLEQLGAGPAAIDVDYAPAARLLTLAPQRALLPFTTYRVLLTRALRAASGLPFAHEIEWSFTTNGDAVWDRAADLAPGMLLACEPSRRGGVLALWAAPDTSLRFAYGDGTSWSPPIAVGIADVYVADVADDETGRVVVAASSRDGNLRVARAPGGTAFAPAEIVANHPFDHVDVDAAASGHAAVGWNHHLGNGHVRLLVPNVGWAAPFTIFGTRPHVHLEPAGHGVAVGAIAYSPFGIGIVHTRCLEYAVDGNGNVTLVDPPLPSVSSYSLLGGSKARFGNDRILLAPTLFTSKAWMNTPLFERTAFGWQQPGPQLGADPRACDVALGPSDPGGTSVVAAATFAMPGLPPVVETRLQGGFDFEDLGTDPAPADPLTGVAITADARINVLWTAAADNGLDAPVRLLSAWRLPSGAAQEPIAVDGPFPAAMARLDALRVVAYGTAGALAVWSRQGVVRFSVLR